MIREKRVLLEASDITHVRLVCTKCQAGVLCSIDDQRPPPSKCPACGQPWWDADTELDVPERDLLRAVQSLKEEYNAQQTGRRPPPSVRLQLEALDE